MKKMIRPMLGVIGLSLTLGATVGFSQQTPPPMSFFVTSVGKGDGGNLGGLAGADAHCQTLAAAVGRGNTTWRAYLSTQGPSPVHARDRIGKGPWYNSKGQMIALNLGHLHGDTLDEARMGNNLHGGTALNEKGGTPDPHDILTGSTLEGTAFTDGYYSETRPEVQDHTCNNWRSNAPGSARVGHSDRRGGGNTSWNSAHRTLGCSQKQLLGTGGAGYFYCFAAN